MKPEEVKPEETPADVKQEKTEAKDPPKEDTGKANSEQDVAASR